MNFENNRLRGRVAAFVFAFALLTTVFAATGAETDAQNHEKQLVPESSKGLPL